MKGLVPKNEVFSISRLYSATPLCCGPTPSMSSQVFFLLLSSRAILTSSVAFRWNCLPVLRTPFCLSNCCFCVLIQESPLALCLPGKCLPIFITQVKHRLLCETSLEPLLFVRKRHFVLMTGIYHICLSTRLWTDRRQGLVLLAPLLPGPTSVSRTEYKPNKCILKWKAHMYF